MSHQTKKSSGLARSSVGQVISSRAHFAGTKPEMNFAYFHSMDIWQKAELDLRRQIKKIKKEEEQEKK